MGFVEGFSSENGSSLRFNDIASYRAVALLKEGGNADIGPAGANELAERIDPTSSLPPEFRPGVALVSPRVEFACELINSKGTALSSQSPAPAPPPTPDPHH